MKHKLTRPKLIEFDPFNYKDQLKRNAAQIRRYFGVTPEKILKPIHFTQEEMKRLRSTHSDNCLCKKCL